MEKNGAHDEKRSNCTHGIIQSHNARITIRVRPTMGEEIFLHLPISATIEYLASTLAQRLKVNKDSMSLCYAGRELTRGTLLSHGLMNDSLVHLLIRTRSGVRRNKLTLQEVLNESLGCFAQEEMEAFIHGRRSLRLRLESRITSTSSKRYIVIEAQLNRAAEITNSDTVIPPYRGASSAGLTSHQRHTECLIIKSESGKDVVIIQIPLSRGAAHTIGSHYNNNIVLNHPCIDEKQAILHFDDQRDQWILMDVRPSRGKVDAGTAINGQHLNLGSECALIRNDQLAMGFIDDRAVYSFRLIRCHHQSCKEWTSAPRYKRAASSHSPNDNRFHSTFNFTSSANTLNLESARGNIAITIESIGSGSAETPLDITKTVVKSILSTAPSIGKNFTPREGLTVEAELVDSKSSWNPKTEIGKTNLQILICLHHLFS